MLVKQNSSQLHGLSAHATPLVQRKAFSFASYLSTEATEFCMHAANIRSPQLVLINNYTTEITLYIFTFEEIFRRCVDGVYFPQI